MEEAKAQTAERLERLFASHADAVYAYAMSRIGPVEAPDVVSETFVVACRRIDDVPEHALPWLLATARRHISTHRRSQGRRERLVEALRKHVTAQPEGRESAHAVRHDIANAMSQLSARDQEVLIVSAWFDLTAKDAALVLGCSAPAYSVRLHRARMRLRRQLLPPSKAHHGSGDSTISGRQDHDN